MPDSTDERPRDGSPAVEQGATSREAAARRSFLKASAIAGIAGAGMVTPLGRHALAQRQGDNTVSACASVNTSVIRNPACDTQNSSSFSSSGTGGTGNRGNGGGNAQGNAFGHTGPR